MEVSCRHAGPSLVMRRQVIVRVSRRVDFHRDQVELAVMNPPLGHHPVGEAADVTGAPLQDDALDAVIMVEVRMHRRHRQVMVFVLEPREALGQVPLVVVVDVREIGDAVRARVALLAQTIEMGPQDVANRFGTVAVTALLDQSIELVCEFVIEGNREAFHGLSGTGVRRV